MFTKFKNSNFYKNYSKITPYIAPYWGRALLAVLITIPVGSMDAVIAWALKPYMDVILIDQQIQATNYLPWLIIGFSALQSILNYISTYMNGWVGRKITNDLQITLFKKLMGYEASFFDKNSSGFVLQRFSGDASLACAGLLGNVKNFSTRIFSSIALIGVLIYNSWQLAIVAIIVMFGALIPMTQVRKKIKHIVEESVIIGASINTNYNEAYNGNRIISAYNLSKNRINRFNLDIVKSFKLGTKMIQRTGFLSPFMHFIVSVGIGFVIWYGSYLIVTKQISPGNFVSFITALVMLYNPIKSIGNSFNSVQLSLMAMDRVFDLLDQEPQIKNCENPIELKSINKNIEFKNVSFEYEKGKPVLENANLNINIGETIAFVGNSGGGKTTMVNLLPRFYDIEQGEILIDGTNIKKLDLYSLRDKIAIVFQDNFLFSGTIRDNIMLGKEDATEAEVNQAVKSACLEEFVTSLELGLDTTIGERGVLLSGGQKQRVAIARAFVKNAPVVILDEATSALDNKSEKIVQQAIENLMKDRTVFVIAHRLTTVRNADKIVVVNYGKIVEIGSHDELITKKDSIYASLHNTQLK